MVFIRPKCSEGTFCFNLSIITFAGTTDKFVKNEVNVFTCVLHSRTLLRITYVFFVFLFITRAS